MKTILVNIAKKAIGFINKCEWNSQIKNEHIDLEKAVSIKDEFNLRQKEKILVIAPHPDDELIGCYNIIKSFNQNVLVFYAGMLGDDKSEWNRNIRTKELINLCENMSVDYAIAKNDYINDLKKLLSVDEIRYIFIPSFVDWHSEHRDVFLSVSQLAKEQKNIRIFCYQVTVPISKKSITHYCEMSAKENAKKWVLFRKIYTSQKFMPVQRFKSTEKAYIKNDKQVYAEVYMALDYNNIDCDRLIKESDTLNKIKSNINDLVRIRNISDLEYTKLFNSEGVLIGIDTIQEIETQMLIFINEICEKNGIIYYIHAGSALGAIRHKGPIPWDDDVDIIVPIKDLDRLIRLLQENLPEKYKLYYREDNKYNQILFPRLCLNGNNPMTAYVDIFPLVGLPDNPKKQIAFSKKADLINKYYKLKYKNVMETKSIIKRVIVFLIKSIVKLLPFGFWQLIFDFHIKKYSFDNAEYVMNPCGMKGTKNIIKKSVYGVPVYVEYNGIQLPIANEFEEYLKHYYGDYMKYPDESVIEKGVAVKKLYYEFGGEKTGRESHL